MTDTSSKGNESYHKGTDFPEDVNAKSFDLCLYHASCPDGTGASWAFWRVNLDRINALNPSFELAAMRHNQPCPMKLMTDKAIVLVDFCYTREVMIEMCKVAKYVLVLDHHKGSERELYGLEEEVTNLAYVFRMDQSGAQIAWEWVNGDSTKMPWFIDIIADRDLWKWEIPHSKEIGKALYTDGWYSWERMEKLYHESKCIEDVMNEFYARGKAIDDNDAVGIGFAIKDAVLCSFGNGNHVKVTTAPPSILSEVGNRLSKEEGVDYAVIYRYSFRLDEWSISLRASDESTLDMSIIAKQYGGGGHPKASGFTIYGRESPTWDTLSEEERPFRVRGTIHDFFEIIEEML